MMTVVRQRRRQRSAEKTASAGNHDLHVSTGNPRIGDVIPAARLLRGFPYRLRRRLMSGQNSSKRFPARRPSRPLRLRIVVWPGVVTLGGRYEFSMMLLK